MLIMKVSEVLDIDGTFEKSTPLKAKDKLRIKGFNVKFSDEFNCEIAEIQTTEGLRYSFGKAIVGQAKSDYWKDTVAQQQKLDSADGLECTVVSKEANNDSGRQMLSLSMDFPSKPKIEAQ